MDFDLDRVIPDEKLAGIEAEWFKVYEPGTTLRTLIETEAAIGYGGHLFEMLDDEDSLYREIALDDDELVEIRTWRNAYGLAMCDHMESFEWPTPVAAARSGLSLTEALAYVDVHGFGESVDHDAVVLAAARRAVDLAVPSPSAPATPL